MMKNAISQSSRTIRAVGAGMAAIVALMAGCANKSAPTAQMAVARVAVSNAVGAGGSQFAPVQTRSALDKMDAAERALAEKDYGRALRLAEQAEVDATLAAEMARSAKAQQAADALQEDIRVLRQEIDRQTQ